LDPDRAIIVPDLVRELLIDDRLERAEAEAGLLAGYYEPARLVCLGVEARGMAASVDAVKAATTIGGSNDPTESGSGGPWASLIGHLLGHDPEAAGRTARDWYAALLRANVATDLPVPNRAVAAYVAGVIAAYTGNDVRAEYWLEVGGVEAELDGDLWTSLFGACRFVRAVVRGHERRPSRVPGR
jgi:hypothetical protein